MTSLMSRDERLYAAFEKLDTNKDGRIDKAEMEKAAKELFDDDDNKVSEEMQVMTLKRLNSAFTAADTNDDGTVDYHEFLQVLHPEIQEKERLSQLLKQGTVEDNYGGAKFNISNKRAKGSLIQPNSYKSQELLKDIDEELDEFNDIDRLEKENENLRSICESQTEELKEKDETIASLQQSLEQRDAKLEELKALIKELEEK